MKRFMLLLGCTAFLLAGCADSSSAGDSQTVGDTSAESSVGENLDLPLYDRRLWKFMDHMAFEIDPNNHYHLVAMHILEITPRDQLFPDQVPESTLFLGYYGYEKHNYRALVYHEGTGILNEMECASAPHCTENVFWFETEQGVQIYDYDFALQNEISMPECSMRSVCLSAETVYGVTESGVVTAQPFSGEAYTVCELDGITVTALHACETELLFVGDTADGACCGRITLADGTYRYDTRSDGGTFKLSPFEGGAVISDAERYQDELITGQFRYWKDGKETVITPEHPVESANVFVSPSGETITTNFCTTEEIEGVEDMFSFLTWVSMYDANGNQQWSEPFGLDSTDNEELIRDQAFLYDKKDYEEMFILEDVEAVWASSDFGIGGCRLMDRIGYDAESMAEIG